MVYNVNSAKPLSSQNDHSDDMDCTVDWFTQYVGVSTRLDFWKCTICQEQFPSKKSLFSHLRDPQLDEHNNLIGHAAKLGRKVFAVPSEYLVPDKANLTKIFEFVYTGTVFPLYETLRIMHIVAAKCQEDHFIFIVRHSHNKRKSNHMQDHIVEAMLAASELHFSGKARAWSLAVICNVFKGNAMPSFAEDLDLEAQMVQGSLEAGSRASRTLCQNVGQASIAFYSTRRIKDQILYAKMQGQRPVIVSMGFDALMHNWNRLSKFAHTYEAQYGFPDIWLCTAKEEAEVVRASVNQVVCPFLLGEQYFGFYSNVQINKHDNRTV